MSARILASLLALVAACDAPAPTDAGIDAGDAGRAPDAGVDAGPPCLLACGSGESCCRDPDGTELCAALRNDPLHCGACGIDCFESARGDACSAMQCTCGDLMGGCNGGRNSFCCPPRNEGSGRYCANLDRDPGDCGACGEACDPFVSDRCSGGDCVCGNAARGPCAGTPESRCCADSLVDVGCVDTTTDAFHCGICNNLCSTGQRCEGGTCTVGTACAGGCALDEVCCDGSCCQPERCTAGVCDVPVDAGPVDAGPIDAGTSDAGPVDAGV